MTTTHEPLAVPFGRTPEEIALGRLLACLQHRLPTLWHLLAQHSLPFVVVYLAPRIGFRTAHMHETNAMYAREMERYLVAHDITEKDNRITHGRWLYLAHPSADA